MTEVYVVIGRGYGDEGKGLATDYLSRRPGRTLVVRHNGGAQSGHTVETEEKRFVFHELSSGSFCHGDTFWARTYLPDLYKLSEERESFERLTGFAPGIYGDEHSCVTLIDDVLVNMAIETKRGKKRHGSCGMGINEADLRTKAGYGVTLGEVKRMPLYALTERLAVIRREYLPGRLKELGMCLEKMGEYGELLQDQNVLINEASAMKENVEAVHLTDNTAALLTKYERVIFEGGQGLLLDSQWAESLPHVTASRTGLTNPLMLLQEAGLTPYEVLYVTRSYLTRHGAGPMGRECTPEEIGKIGEDQTNRHNDWQGSLRYGYFESLEEFMRPMREDLKDLPPNTRVSLLITHLNETSGRLRFADGDMTVEEFMEKPEIKNLFAKVYVSYSRYSKDIR